MIETTFLTGLIYMPPSLHLHCYTAASATTLPTSVPPQTFHTSFTVHTFHNLHPPLHPPIGSRVIKVDADQLCGLMAHIINLSLKLGRVPLLWKISSMVLVQKSRRPKDFNNFRLVALTSHPMKTMNQLVLCSFGQ